MDPSIIVGQLDGRADVRFNLGPWGTFTMADYGDRRSVDFISALGRTVRVGDQSGFPSGCVRFAAHQALGWCLLLDEEGRAVYWLDAAAMRLVTVATLRRWRLDNEGYDPGGLYRVRLVGIAGGILLDYECGCVVVNVGGALRWQQEFTCFSYCLGVREGVVWYEGNDWEGVPWEGRWGYRLHDGERVTP